MAEKILLSWSGGKDSALTLYELQKDKNYEIIALVTTITEDYDRVSMHGVRSALIEQQADSLGIELEKVLISRNAFNQEYESKLFEVLSRFMDLGINMVAFGDLFLEDIRRYREDFLKKIGMQGIFPIWKRNTRELAEIFLNLGFKAIISCVDSELIDKSFAGREFDEKFLLDLPSKADPCGENGEFHSFVYEG
ncbi:MAG: hypothetical protein ACRENZ_07915, partial [Thermodesulfobacteriota bacterium]